MKADERLYKAKREGKDRVIMEQRSEAPRNIYESFYIFYFLCVTFGFELQGKIIMVFGLIYLDKFIYFDIQNKERFIRDSFVYFIF